MDFIKNWTFSICLTLIISLVFSIISPKGNMGRFYKVIIAVFIFASFIVPAAEFEPSDLTVDFDIESEYYDVSAEAAQKQVEALISDELKKNNIEPETVECKVSPSGNEISIDSVIVTISNNVDAEEVEKQLFDGLGIVAQVRYVGE